MAEAHLKKALIWMAATLVQMASGAWAEEVFTPPADMVAGQTDGAVTYSNTVDGHAVVSFQAAVVSPYSPPPFCAGTLVASDTGVANPFRGDYVGAGYTSLTFRIRGGGPIPASVIVFLESSVSGRRWVNSRVAVSPLTGAWMTASMPLSRAAGWERGGRDLDAKWAADIKSVGRIGMRIAQGGLVGQSYEIADFCLVSGSGQESYVRDALSPLEQALLDRFGVTTPDSVSESDSQIDGDADGMPDLVEILSRFDVEFANRMFAAEIVSVAGDGVTVKWPCVEGWMYTLFRAARMTDEFQTLPDGVGVDILATQTGYMVFVDVDAGLSQGPFYYKVRRRQ